MLTRAPTRDLQDLLRWLSTTPPAQRDEAENELYESCFQLTEAVQRLEHAAGRPGSAAATAAALHCLAESLDGIASSVEDIGDEFDFARQRKDLPKVRHERFLELIRAAAQDLRLAQASIASAQALSGPISRAA